MAYGQIDPARLEGEALRRWYLRSPAEIEDARRSAADQRYDLFFSPLPRVHAVLGRTAGDAVGRHLTGAGETAGFREESTASPLRFQMASAAAGGAPRATPGECISCHGILPPLTPTPLPPPIGTFPFPIGGMPSFRRGTPRGGSSSRGDKYPQCGLQYEADSEICREARSRACWENAAERQGYCRSHEGEVGWPPLHFGGR